MGEEGWLLCGKGLVAMACLGHPPLCHWLQFPSQKGGNERAASAVQPGGLQTPATASPAALLKSPWHARQLLQP